VRLPPGPPLPTPVQTALWLGSPVRFMVRTVLEHARLRPASPRPEGVRLHAVAMVPGRGARVVLAQRRNQVR